MNELGATLEVVQNGVTLSGLEPDDLVNAEVVPLSQKLGEQNVQIEVRLTTKNPVPVGGYILLEMPFWNQGTGQKLTMIDNNQPTCRATQGGALIGSCVQEGTSTGSTLKIQLQNALQANLRVVVTVSDFRNPYNYADKVRLIRFNTFKTGFTILTSDSSGGLIDRTPADLSIKISQPGDLIIQNVYHVYEAHNSILQETTLGISFNLNIPLDAGCSAIIELPAGFGTSSVNKVVLQNGVQEFNMRFTQIQNKLSLTNICDSYIELVDPVFKIEGVLNPASVGVYSDFKITIFDTFNQVLVKNPLGFDFNDLKAGQLINSAVQVLGEPKVAAVIGLSVQFTPEHHLPMDSHFKLTLPHTLTLTGTCTVTTPNFTDLASTLSCSILNSNSVVVSNMFYSSGYQPNMGSISLSFPDLVLAPPFVQDIGEFTLQTMLLKDKDLCPVDEAVVVNPFEVQAAVLNVKVDLDPSINMHFPTKVTVEFNSESSIQAGSIVVFHMPPEFKTLNHEIIQSSCIPELGFTTTSLSCTLVGQTIVVSGGISRDLVPLSTVSFSVDGIETPRYSGAVEEAFRVEILNSQQKTVAAGDFHYEVQQTQSLLDCGVKLGSETNSALTVLNFDFRSQVQIEQTDSVEIQLKAEAVALLPEQLNCGQFVCQMHSQDVLKITSVVWKSNTEINLVQFRAPESTKPIQIESFGIFNLDGKPIMKCDNNLVIQTSKPAVSSEFELVQSSTQPDSEADFTLKLNSGSFDQVKVDFPECLQSASRQLEFDTSDSEIEFKVALPSQSCSASITVTTYSDGYALQTAELPVMVGCASPCTNCEKDSDGRDICVACEPTFDLKSSTCVEKCAKVLLGTKCIDSCPEGMKPVNLNGETICQQCELGCAECSEKQCLNCMAGFVNQNNKCQKHCDQNYTDVDSICQSAESDQKSQVDVQTEPVAPVELQTTEVIEEEKQVIYFPFLSCFLFFTILSLGSFGLNRNTQLVSLIQTAASFLLHLALFMQSLLCMFTEDHKLQALFPVSITVYLSMLFVNILYLKNVASVYDNSAGKAQKWSGNAINYNDFMDYQCWRSAHPRAEKAMCILTILFGWRCTNFYSSGCFICMNFLNCKLNNLELRKLRQKLRIVELIQYFVTVLGAGAGVYFVMDRIVEIQVGVSMIESATLSSIALILLVRELKKGEPSPTASNKGESIEMSMEELQKSSQVDSSIEPTDQADIENQKEQTARVSHGPFEISPEAIQVTVQSSVDKSSFISKQLDPQSSCHDSNIKVSQPAHVFTSPVKAKDTNSAAIVTVNEVDSDGSSSESSFTYGNNTGRSEDKESKAYKGKSEFDSPKSGIPLPDDEPKTSEKSTNFSSERLEKLHSLEEWKKHRSLASPQIVTPEMSLVEKDKLPLLGKKTVSQNPK